MNQRLKKAVAERFAEVRAGRSYLRFAKDSKISTSLLQRYETGGGLPSVENLTLLAEREGISIDWLLLGVGDMRD
jgi:transcriptional regulator with XRE-family HTH domain